MKPPRARLILLLGALGCLVLVGVWKGGSLRQRASPQGPTAPRPAAVTPAQIQAYLALEARESAVAQSVWKAELDGERHEDYFLRLWDSLNATSNSWPVLAGFQFGSIQLPEWSAPAELPHGIRRWRGNPSRKPPSAFARWGEQLSQWQSGGWSLSRTTWHVNQHTPAKDGNPARSGVILTAQLANGSLSALVVIRAELDVTWAGDNGAGVLFPEHLVVRTAEFLRHDGPMPFTPWLDAELPPGTPEFPDPLIAADLDGDGLSELLLVGANQLWRNRPAIGNPHAPRQFVAETFAKLPTNRIVASVLADVNGDGRADLVFAGAAGLSWIAGEPAGGFPGKPQTGWAAQPALKHPQVIAVGDVDGDGDLDVWLAQYKLPYQGGQFPTPYYDANDGFPAHLLLNDGHGHFTEATAGSGLAAKRFRRTYSASFVDLDGDGDLDLVNVSDFAGTDVYLNDGHGKFTDVTDRLGETRHAFGMAHVLGDFNDDGRPDLLMLGMDSPMAQRLDALGLGRAEWPHHTAKRASMTFGNRLLLGSDHGPLPAPLPLATALAHTGWTWGAAAADFDNDRRLDLATANGHETRPSTTDYERQFWRHDIYVGSSTNDPAAELYYRAAAGRRQAEGVSYGGWQANSLLLNCGGADFPDIAWLLGLAVPADCHNLLADDLDGDGRLDLIVTTFEQWPVKRQRLLVFHNELPQTNHWIGFRLDGGGRVPVGARVELEDTAGHQTRWLVAGDSFRSQSAAAAHFGLGTNTPVQAIIHWPDGRRTRLPTPAINRWHSVSPPP